ncbi:unnamed protein product [Owenia fusiformis]|uniref:Uncharacterized protein n=1 Tax=Owenia fusiformis TaxID=6347 RepID=A0A8J1XNQ8_OWEFU|nr:unnamed protein product [Owenia fusiformis]
MRRYVLELMHGVVLVVTLLGCISRATISTTVMPFNGTALTALTSTGQTPSPPLSTEEQAISDTSDTTLPDDGRSTTYVQNDSVSTQRFRYIDIGNSSGKDQPISEQPVIPIKYVIKLNKTTDKYEAIKAPNLVVKVAQSKFETSTASPLTSSAIQLTSSTDRMKPTPKSDSHFNNVLKFAPPFAVQYLEKQRQTAAPSSDSQKPKSKPTVVPNIKSKTLPHVQSMLNSQSETVPAEGTANITYNETRVAPKTTSTVTYHLILEPALKKQIIMPIQTSQTNLSGSNIWLVNNHGSFEKLYDSMKEQKSILSDEKTYFTWIFFAILTAVGCLIVVISSFTVISCRNTCKRQRLLNRDNRLNMYSYQSVDSVMSEESYSVSYA